MKRALATLVFVVALPGLAACGSSSKAASPSTAAPTDLRGKTAVEIDASSNQFNPASIIIDAGTKVTWRNGDSVAHNVKKSADAVDFGAPFGVDLDAFGPGKTYSFTFTKPGMYAYQCTVHSLMTGSVDVRAKA
jgi:plastocyanin